MLQYRLCESDRLKDRVKKERDGGGKFLSVSSLYVWAKPLSSDPPPTEALHSGSLSMGADNYEGDLMSPCALLEGTMFQVESKTHSYTVNNHTCICRHTLAGLTTNLMKH